MSNWRWRQEKTAATPAKPGAGGDIHLELARQSLSELLHDSRVPKQVRDALAEDYRQIEAMLEKLEQGHVHIAAFGRVSVGKSALLNALLGEQRFSTSPLHGETRQADMVGWDSYDAGGVFLIDTPGINEVAGEAREKLAHDVASRSDMVLFVLDGDITETERQALNVLATIGRPILIVMNKSDRYTADELAQLRVSIEAHTAGLVDAGNIVSAAAQPAPQTVIMMENGKEVERTRQREPDVATLKQRLWAILESEGKSLVALNATLFAGNLSDQVAQRLVDVRKTVAERVVRVYCVAKGVAVALNPVPVADLFAAAIMDVTMVLHLSRVYGLPMTRREAGALVQAIFTQMLLLMGTVWAVHLVSSALKVGTGGLSTAVTAGAQGAVAYYGTYVVGQVAKRYFAQGKSWGPAGPKQVVGEILDGLNRDSIMGQAREDILAHLRKGGVR